MRSDWVRTAAAPSISSFVTEEIVGTGPSSFTTKEFSPQVWEPFAAWVSATYPKDAAVMYDGASLTNYELTDESIRLWEKHTQEYVEMVNAGTLG